MKIRAGYQTKEGPIWTIEKTVDNITPIIGMFIDLSPVLGNISSIETDLNNNTIATIGEVISLDHGNSYKPQGCRHKLIDLWDGLSEQGWVRVCKDETE